MALPYGACMSQQKAATAQEQSAKRRSGRRRRRVLQRLAGVSRRLPVPSAGRPLKEMSPPEDSGSGARNNR